MMAVNDDRGGASPPPAGPDGRRAEIEFWLLVEDGRLDRVFLLCRYALPREPFRERC